MIGLNETDCIKPHEKYGTRCELGFYNNSSDYALQRVLAAHFWSSHDENPYVKLLQPLFACFYTGESPMKVDSALKTLAALAIVFGLLTIFSGGVPD